MEREVKYINIRSVHFRTLHADGIIVTNSPSNVNQVHLHFYSDRFLIPDQIIFDKEAEDASEEMVEITREFEASIKLDVETAKDFLKDLDSFLKSI